MWFECGLKVWVLFKVCVKKNSVCICLILVFYSNKIFVIVVLVDIDEMFVKDLKKFNKGGWSLEEFLFGCF